MKHPILLLLFCLQVPTQLWAQISYNSISGKVLNAKNKQGVPYAQVKISNSSLGVITNFEGEFRVNIPERFFGDSLTISSIGYVSQRISVRDLIDTDIVEIALREKIYSLEEIAIRERKGKEFTADEIVRKALVRIRKNYPRDPYVLSGYYRDYLWKDKQYTNLLEAAVHIADPGFGKYDYNKTQVYLDQVRYRKDFEVDTSLSKGYADGNKEIPEMVMRYSGANELAILRLHDPIRNYKHPSFAFIFVLQKYFRENHDFRLDSLIIQDQQLIYEISFSLKKDPAFPHEIDGKIFIRSKDFAILKLRYSNLFTPQENKEGIRYEILVEYQDFQDQLFLKYLSMNNYLDVKTGDPEFFIDTVKINTRANRIIAHFNQPLDFRSTDDPKNFKIRLRGVRYNIKTLVQSDVQELTFQLEQQIGSVKADEIQIEAQQVISAYGQLLESVPTEAFYQYREFFVNEISAMDPITGKSMDKELPMYKQGVVKTQGFWETYNRVLNQPLKQE